MRREQGAITAMRLAFHGTDNDLRDHAARRDPRTGGPNQDDETAAALAAFGLREVTQ
ncbi:MAG: hypothetical protein Q7J57_05510 [Gemmobacter sp.]|nr:hypothetical protein [Gemmobacter sp.]